VTVEIGRDALLTDARGIYEAAKAKNDVVSMRRAVKLCAKLGRAMSSEQLRADFGQALEIAKAAGHARKMLQAPEALRRC
jgi:hypothetical protein